MGEGIWCGTHGRIEEVFSDTKKGGVNCWTVTRPIADKRWGANLAHETDGTTWQPAPGHKGDDVLAEINDDGTPNDRAVGDDDSVSYGVIPIEGDNMAAVRQKA